MSACAKHIANKNSTEENYDNESLNSSISQALLNGLLQPHKTINPQFFYDEQGSELFHQITLQPEYYPTRTETSILKMYSHDIAGCVRHADQNQQTQRLTLIEPGAGTCEKIRYLLDDIRPDMFIPQDISKSFLQKTAEQLKKDYPWLHVSPIAGDFNDAFTLPESTQSSKKVVFYPGSTIGNFTPEDATNFLKRMRSFVGDDGGMVIGVDLEKDTMVLDRAYNDAAGYTAQFNLNILNHVNRLLNADFDLSQFSHYAYYNEKLHRIEMHLISRKQQHVQCNGHTIQFEKGERIHTENSYKYTVESFSAMAETAGFTIETTWLDENRWFSVHYLRAIS